MRIVFLILLMLVPAKVWAQDACPAQLQQSQYEASIIDNQRAATVRDLAKANRIIAEFRIVDKALSEKVAQLERELAKAKTEEKKAEGQ